jgi:NADPH:quinone reductase-like Zn-dependent oxidoreductase
MTERDLATDTMRPLRFQDDGEPGDVLNLETARVPDPGPDRIRIVVHACGLAPADWALCRGLFAGQLPRGIGCDVSGTVDAVGDGVTDVAVGDLVFDTAPVGGALPDLVAIADGDPARVLTISDSKPHTSSASATASTRTRRRGVSASTPSPSSRSSLPTKSSRYRCAHTVALENWRAALEVSLSGHAQGKLLLLP